MKKFNITKITEDDFSGISNLSRVRTLASKINAIIDYLNDTDGGTITPDQYITITREATFVGGEPTTKYNGEDIYNCETLPEYFVCADALFDLKHDIRISEIHVIQASNCTDEHYETGTPIPDPKGQYAWTRIKTTDGRVSSWVFHCAYASGGDCAVGCAYSCAYDVQYNASFRYALFSGLGSQLNDADKKVNFDDSKVKEMEQSSYLTITVDDIFLNGESTKTYNGHEIWCKDDVIEYFSDAIDLFKSEHNIDVAELHVLQSSTAGEYATAGYTVPDKNGIYAWVRIKTADGRLSSWMFLSAYASGGDCAVGCAHSCAYDVLLIAAFRSALFSGLDNNHTQIKG